MSISSYKGAPAHPLRVLAGVFFFSTVVAACEDGLRIGDSGPRTVELESDTVQLEPGVTLHDVTLRASSEGDFQPAQITAKSGDVVRFTSGDTRTHALSIRPPSEPARAALAASDQLRSPPLIARETAWVVSLKGLPAGVYTVSCISHAGTATIQIQ